MRVLIVGASGMIGSALAARLAAEGHDVAAVARRPQSGAASHWLRLDLARIADPQAWLPHLAGVDAVVNCAGTLQDAPGNSTAGVHARGAAALFAACARAGVRRVVQVSAIGVDRAATAFSRTKREGEEALKALDLDWVILRPSVVLGRAAYGGGALLRALAASPLLPVMPQTAPLPARPSRRSASIRSLFFLPPGAPSRHVDRRGRPDAPIGSTRSSRCCADGCAGRRRAGFAFRSGWRARSIAPATPCRCLDGCRRSAAPRGARSRAAAPAIRRR